LKLSGIGPAEELREQGISVLADRPGDRFKAMMRLMHLSNAK